VDRLDRSGFWSERTLAVHCVELDAYGREVLAARGTAVSYKSGIAPVPEMLDLGITVGIGVDGAASNDTQDMIETIRAGGYRKRATADRPASWMPRRRSGWPPPAPTGPSDCRPAPVASRSAPPRT
jgi:cytosine/adenosine deaminase-related metal-dependent hydrolase